MSVRENPNVSDFVWIAPPAGYVEGTVECTVAVPHDAVNHPSHYTAGAVECIDAIREALGYDGFLAYCRGNAMKYLWRAGLKGDAQEDLRKAAWYATRAGNELAPLAR